MTKHRARSRADGPRSGREVSRVTAIGRGERSIPATEAKNRFGEVLQAAERGPVFIAKRGRNQAVVLDIGSYQSLLAQNRTPDEQRLEKLRQEFDALYAHMQTDEARAVTDRFLAASDDEINRAVGPRG